MATGLPDLDRCDSFPKLVRHNAANHGADIAIREKDLGLWNSFDWRDYADRVRAFALGLHALGVGVGDVVALIGNNRPDWVFGEIAAHAVRAISLGIYRDALDDEVEYLIGHARARVVFAEDEEQVDKLLSLADRIASVERIVYSDPRGMRKYKDPRLISRTDLVRQGEAAAARDSGLYDRLVDATTGQDVAVLCTTSGTISHPKLAELSAGMLLRHSVSYLKADPRDSTDEYVSVLPLPWIVEQVFVFAQALLIRYRVNFVEEPETLMADMREIGPSFLIFAPRVWEAIAADVRARIMDASPLKRAAYACGLRLGERALARGGRSRLAGLLLFRALRDRLGFTRLRSAATGGAAMGPDTFRFFHAMGVPLRQLYGQTELLGAYTIHRPDDIKVDTVGVPFDDSIELRIDHPDANGVGEIVCRHPNMFRGYFGNEDATREAVRDGWMFTGDAGYFDDHKHLVVIDRIADLATTARDARFSPQFIENKLKFSPYIAEAVVLGHAREYLAAILCIRYSIVSKWAERRRINFTTFTDLSSREQVYALIRDEVDRVNASLPAAQRVRRFLLLYKELDADDGELTRTRKVRRGVIGEKYANIIDALYSERDAVDIDTTITYQDGTRQRIRTTLGIVELDTGGTAPASARARAA